MSTPDAPIPSQYTHVMGWIGGGRVVSLTFDDGPGPMTSRVLDLLARYGIKATFCQIGRQIADYPDTEKRIIAEGHAVCNHTWDHDEQLAGKSVAVIDSEIQRTQQAVSSLTGATPRFFRAPGGDFGTTNRLRHELVKFKTVPLGWGVDSEDWRKPGVQKIVSNVMSEVSPGAIILMHDAGGDRSQTLAALPLIITKLRSAGYSFVPLP